MSRSLFIFFGSITALMSIAYFMPREPTEVSVPPSTLANQAAILYLQMHERPGFELDNYLTACKSLQRIAPESNSVDLTVAFVRFLEGPAKESPSQKGAGPGWALLAYLQSETKDFPDVRANLNLETWVHLALLQKAYEKAGQKNQAAQTAIDLRFLENRLNNQARLASVIELLSLMGLALLIQSLFQWNAAKKMSWDMFTLDAIPIPQTQIAKLVGLFFVGYLGLQLLFSQLSGGVSIMLLAYLCGIALAWLLLKFYWFDQSIDILKLGGLDQVKMSFPIAIHALFGFCILIFLSHLAAFALHWIDWPFDNIINERLYRDLLSHPVSASGMVFLSCMLAPVAEELFFRGLLMKALAFHLGKWHAVLWSAFLFAMFHPLSFFPLVFILGLCLGLVYMRSKSLLAPILTHVLWNAFTLMQIQAGL